MEVLFEHRAKINNKMVLLLPSGKSVVFVKGVFVTTEKQVVRDLFAHPFFKRKKFSMKSDKALVEDWLTNDKEPEYLTLELVNEFSNELINELAEELDLSNKGYPELLKSELIRQPVTNQVKVIIDKYAPKKEQKQSTASKSTRKRPTKIEEKTEE